MAGRVPPEFETSGPVRAATKAGSSCPNCESVLLVEDGFLTEGERPGGAREEACLTSTLVMK